MTAARAFFCLALSGGVACVLPPFEKVDSAPPGGAGGVGGDGGVAASGGGGAGGVGGGGAGGGGSGPGGGGTGGECFPAPNNDTFAGPSLVDWDEGPNNDGVIVSEAFEGGNLVLRAQDSNSNTYGWFGQSSRGWFIYRQACGDFLMIAHVSATAVSSTSLPPGGQYNSVGLLARDGVSAHEYWTYLSVGSQNGLIGAETKRTSFDVNGGMSVLVGYPNGYVDDADVLMCRFGDSIRLATRAHDTTNWNVHDEYEPAELVLPREVQVGVALNAWSGRDLEAIVHDIYFHTPLTYEACLPTTF
jgi:hypothetical protein